MISSRACFAILLVFGLAGGTPEASAAPPVCSEAPDAFQTRTDLAAGSLLGGAQQLVRFVQLSDVHILDDDGAVAVGGSVIDPTISRVSTAQRLQDEYTDEVLNAMVGTLNACHASEALEFMIATGDNTDLSLVNETRRFIDNLDGTFDAPTAYEPKCAASLPAETPVQVRDLYCKTPTGKGVADTQTVDPNPNNFFYQFTQTRAVLQFLDTLSAVISGRDANNGRSGTRQTFNRAPGLPAALRCNAGDAGCEHFGLSQDLPWYAVFGNHDGTLRGTIPYEPGIQVIASGFGRHFMQLQHEFIDEFFKTKPLPGPIGHGFDEADPARKADVDERNDGYYGFDWPEAAPKFRMIVLNTLIDGVEGGVDLGTLPVFGPVQVRNPFALESGAIDAEQFAWLKGELAAAEAAGKLVLVFSHHPDLSFAEFGQFAFAVPAHTTAAQLDGELASHPNVIAWIAGHTHRNRIRAFKVTGNTVGTNGTITAPVNCPVGKTCPGFWEIETASLIDSPQEGRILEVFDNLDGTGVIKATLLEHGFTRSKTLADADDRCQFYLDDTASVQRLVTEGDLTAICEAGGTSGGEAGDRNVHLVFKMP